jgi:hypothetical protein
MVDQDGMIVAAVICLIAGIYLATQSDHRIKGVASAYEYQP